MSLVDKAAIAWSIGIVAAFIGIAFAGQGMQDAGQVAPLTETTESTDSTQIANPSATFCIENSGTYTPDDSGATCTLVDGTMCNAWKYFRGECTADNPTYISPEFIAACEENGGTITETYLDPEDHPKFCDFPEKACMFSQYLKDKCVEVFEGED